MIEPTPIRHNSDSDTPVGPTIEETPVTKARSGHRWLMPAAAIMLVSLGGGALIAVPFSSGNTSEAPAATAPAAVAFPASPRTVTAASSAATASNLKDVPISQLADPDWVKRIAAEGNIPERALFAYAGAALSVAQTNPSCGIGWNTLAAIGQVESEHGTMNGTHLDSRGVAVPTIIGAALDGKAKAKIPDTDHGQYDGDTTWDHAVGPMQFIPSTWAHAGQDGDRDGTKDINQIDDAALAAALHLCEVGGDLTVAQNWINAISAYNDSVEYNNKVAATATQYASLP